MKKDAFYFPHFSTARHDRKLKRVQKELGIEGYGIYFMLLEVLREQPEMSYPIEDLDLLADEFGTSEQKVRTVVCNYQLFEVQDNKLFFSLKLMEYMQPYLRMKQQRIDAGRASAAKRMLNDRSTTVQQSKVKESKVKESKVLYPALIEVIEYFTTNGYSEQLATKAFNYYSVADWKDGKGKQVKNWKQKMQSVWFKDENKITSQPSYRNPDGSLKMIM